MNMNALPLRLLILCCLTFALAGCQTARHTVKEVEEPPPPPPIQEPLATHVFEFDPDVEVVGLPQITVASAEDTFSDIARRFNLGYEELVRANPGVDPWLPGAGREIVLPTQFVLPNAPREGLVINLAALRVFYFPKVKEGEPRKVITHPIGIGKVGWSTPQGSTRVTGKTKNPWWFPPASVRKEHREAGDPLPSKVPPGPDNPLGAHMMTLGWKSYLIHGTNKPYGVGMRSSHGCIRFYPEDIAQLYDMVPVRTPVHVVNQPVVFGWHKDALYMQVFPRLEEDGHTEAVQTDGTIEQSVATAMWNKAKQHNVAIDQDLARTLASQARGIAAPISQRGVTLETYLAQARHVENKIPQGATWDGREDLLVSAEEFNAVRSGTPTPKKPAASAARKAPRETGKPASATSRNL